MAVGGGALAADVVHSPRGKEAEAASKSVSGYPERQALTFSSKADLTPRAKSRSKASAGTNAEPDLVREARRQVYTGKNAPQRPAFEIAPAK